MVQGFSFWISARLLVRHEISLQNIQITIMTMFFAAFTLGTIGPYIQAKDTQYHSTSAANRPIIYSWFKA